MSGSFAANRSDRLDGSARRSRAPPALRLSRLWQLPGDRDSSSCGRALRPSATPTRSAWTRPSASLFEHVKHEESTAWECVTALRAPAAGSLSDEMFGMTVVLACDKVV